MTVRDWHGLYGPWENLPIPSLYLHPAEGEGVHVMPEVGAPVWLCIPSEGDERPFPISYAAMVDTAQSRRSNRPVLNPGDMVFMTRDRNGVKIRRGGVVEIVSNPTTRMMLIPTSNRILTICENWEQQHFGGSLKWTTARPEEDPDGKFGTQVDWSVKEFADDKSCVARLRMGGQIDESGSPIVDLRVFRWGGEDSDEDALTESTTLSIERLGHVGLTVASFTEVVDEKATAVTTDDSRTFTESGKVSVDIKDGAVRVFETDGNEQGIILGKTFLTQLKAAMTEMMAVATAVGMPAVETAKLLAEIETSIGAGTGIAPYLSTRLKAE